LATASYTAPPSAATITDAVWDEATSEHTASGSFGRFIGTTLATLWSGITSMANWLRALARSSTPDATALSEINSGGGTYDATTDSLEALGTDDVEGSGPYTATVTITDADDAPLESVAVSLTKGATRLRVLTNASGVAEFLVENGTWAVRAFLAGYSMSAATLVVAGANKSQTYEMSAVTISPSADPEQCVCFGVIRDGNGDAVVGATLEYRLLRGPGTGGSIYSREWSRSAASDANGLVQVPMPRGAWGEFRYDDGIAVRLPIPDEDSFELTEILGLAH
jgi:hypothetical protein